MSLLVFWDWALIWRNQNLRLGFVGWLLVWKLNWEMELVLEIIPWNMLKSTQITQYFRNISNKLCSHTCVLWCKRKRIFCLYISQNSTVFQKVALLNLVSIHRLDNVCCPPLLYIEKSCTPPCAFPWDFTRTLPWIQTPPPQS